MRALRVARGLRYTKRQGLFLVAKRSSGIRFMNRPSLQGEVPQMLAGTLMGSVGAGGVHVDLSLCERPF